MHEPLPGSITFFIPCLNEEGNVGQAIDTVISVMQGRANPFEILVIDDDSRDGSVAEVLGRRTRHPSARIEILKNKFRRGLGRNYFIASHRASGEHFMLVNGDAVEPPETIAAIVGCLGQAEAVVPYPGLNENRTLARRLLSRGFTFLVGLFSGHCLRYYNGPVLHRTENVRMWFAETRGFGYQAELLCRLLDEGMTYVEVPIAHQDRQHGVSKALTIGNILSVSNTLFHIFLRRLEKIAFWATAGKPPSAA